MTLGTIELELQQHYAGRMSPTPEIWARNCITLYLTQCVERAQHTNEFVSDVWTNDKNFLGAVQMKLDGEFTGFSKLVQKITKKVFSLDGVQCKNSDAKLDAAVNEIIQKMNMKTEKVLQKEFPEPRRGITISVPALAH